MSERVLVSGLTSRQREVLERLAECRNVKSIAADLTISERRVRQIIGELGAALDLDPSCDIRAQIAQRYAPDDRMSA